MQRGQLHRDRRCGEHVRVRATGADGQDRLPVRFQVTARVGGGEGGFAQHVEGMAVMGALALVRALQRFADRAPHHELVAHDAHGLTHREPDGRLAHPPDQAPEGAAGIATGLVGQADQVAGQQQAPGGGVDQDGARPAKMRVPVGVAELVADQPVGRVLVGNAQQGLGDAHQQHALLRAQVVLAHERLDHRRIGGANARALDQAHRGGLHRRLLRGRQSRLLEQFLQVRGLVAQGGGGDALAQRRRVRGQFGAEDWVHGGDRPGGAGKARFYRADGFPSRPREQAGRTRTGLGLPPDRAGA